jgi:hypothetical protein
MSWGRQFVLAGSQFKPTVEIASGSQWKWQEVKLEPKETGPESTNKGLDRERVTEKRERTVASVKFRCAIDCSVWRRAANG